MIEEKVTPFATWLREYGFNFSGHYSDKRSQWRRVKFFNVTSSHFKEDEFELAWPVIQKEAIRYYKAKHPNAAVNARMIREAKHDHNLYSIIIEIV